MGSRMTSDDNISEENAYEINGGKTFVTVTLILEKQRVLSFRRRSSVQAMSTPGTHLIGQSNSCSSVQQL